MNRILVPLDGSRLSEAVVPMVEALGRDYQAELVLLRALPPRLSLDTDREVQREAEAYLAGMVTHLQARGLKHVRWRLWYGDPDLATVGAATTDAVSLIAMSTHGRGGLNRLRFGSVAENVVRRAPAPVFLVRGELSASRSGIGRILVPLDGSERSEAVLPVVERLAGPFDLTIELLHAVEPIPPGEVVEVSTRGDELMRLRTGEAEAYLSKVAKAVEAKGLRVGCTVREGAAVDVILRHAREERVGLIAMNTHGRTGLGRLVLGSVAEQVLRAASMPVLLWRAPPDGGRSHGGART